MHGVGRRPPPSVPKTYTPIQYRYPDGDSFKHEALKWVHWQSLAAFPVENPALAPRLKDEAARFFAALGGTGFGRCDVRVDADGTPFWLEINPQCGVYGPESFGCSADLILLHDPAGHAGFTRQIVVTALARHARKLVTATSQG